jgi:MFS family permease
VAALCAVRGLLGLVSAPLHPAAARAVSLWFPPRSRGTANGLVTAAALLGIAASYPVFGWLMDAVGWPKAFFAMGVVTLAMTAAWWAWTDDRRPHEDRPSPAESLDVVESPQTREAFVALLRNRSLILLMLSYAMLSYFQYLFFYWMQHYLDVVLKLGKSDARLYTMIPTLAMAVGMAVGGWLLDRAEARYPGRVGRIIVPGLGMLASGVFLALGIVGDGVFWVVGFFSLALAALGASEASFWVTGVELGRSRGGLSASILNTVGNVGGMIAPVVTPLFSDYFGWKAGLFLASALCIVGAALWLWIDPKDGVGARPAVEALA